MNDVNVVAMVLSVHRRRLVASWSSDSSSSTSVEFPPFSSQQQRCPASQAQRKVRWNSLLGRVKFTGRHGKCIVTIFKVSIRVRVKLGSAVGLGLGLGLKLGL